MTKATTLDRAVDPLKERRLREFGGALWFTVDLALRALEALSDLFIGAMFGGDS